MAKKSEKITKVDGVQSVSDFFKTEDFVAPTFRPDQMVGVPSILNAWELETSDNGDYIILECSNVQTGADYRITTSIEAIMTPIVRLGQNLPLPVAFTIVPYGKSFKMV